MTGGIKVIKGISIIQYRKMRDLQFSFVPGINILSGTNGTCKTSLLHIISNSFQAVTKKCDWIQDTDCLEVIKRINGMINPKIETLARGDKQHNDPTNGKKGTIFTIEYFDREPLAFRKHESKLSNRYAIKPYYKRGAHDTLPYCPVIYLGLARLFPFGEFQNDNAIEGIKKRLPVSYQQEITEIYERFTGIKIVSSEPQKMGDIRVRADFLSNKVGIDSNTISAGEDNLFMLITAIVSLKYYYESIQSRRTTESILLIDEMDATLHPSYQFKLLDLFDEYAEKYKFQIIFTTHSLSLIEYAIKKRHNVVYLIDNITNVLKMDSPDIYKIKMYLYNVTRDDIYRSKVIPVFTEDAEARIFFKTLIEYFEDTKADFTGISKYFHLVDANIGAGNLVNIFNDTYLLRTTMQAICLLDGDQRDKRNLDKYIITLPGGESPEKMIMEYAINLYDNNEDNFWTNETIIDLNFGKIHFRDNIKPDVEEITVKIGQIRENGGSTRGVERELRKKVFNKHERFFELLFKYWVRNSDNTDEVNRFYSDLFKMFKKVAEFHGINPNLWNIA